MTISLVFHNDTHLLVSYCSAGWKHGQMNCVLLLESARAEIQVASGLGVKSGCSGGNPSLEFMQAIFRIQFPAVGGMSFSAGYHS